MSKAVFMGREDVIFPKMKVKNDFSQFSLFTYLRQALNEIGEEGFTIIVWGATEKNQPHLPYRDTYDRITDQIRAVLNLSIAFLTCYHGNERCDCLFPQGQIIKDILESFRIDINESYFIVTSNDEFLMAKIIGFTKIISLGRSNQKWITENKDEIAGHISNISKLIEILQMENILNVIAS